MLLPWTENDIDFDVPFGWGGASGLLIGTGTTEGDQVCETFPIIDDEALEFDHSFSIGLGSSEPSGVTQTPGTFSSTEVTITDDEGDNLCIYV